MCEKYYYKATKLLSNINKASMEREGTNSSFDENFEYSKEKQNIEAKKGKRMT